MKTLQIESKFDIGDKVYYMKQNKIQWGHITCIHLHYCKGSNWSNITYSIDGYNCGENADKLFATKEELIAAL